MFTIARMMLLLSWSILSFVQAEADPGVTDTAIVARSLTNQPTPDSLWQWQILVTNRGPAAIGNLRLRIDMPCAQTFTNTTFVQVQPDAAPGVFSVAVPLLEAQGGSLITFSVKPRQDYPYGYATNTFTLVGNDSDPTPDDNQAVVTQFMGPSETHNSIVNIPIPARNLLFDAARHRLYGVERNPSDTNSVTLFAVDSEVFTNRTLRLLPGPLGPIHLSADNRYLYSLTSGGSTLLRIDLADQESDLSTRITGLITNALAINDFVVDSRDPHAAVLLYQDYTGTESLVAVRDGTLMTPRYPLSHPLPAGGWTPAWQIGPAANSGEFLVFVQEGWTLATGYEVVRLATDAMESVAQFISPNASTAQLVDQSGLVQAFSTDGTQPFSITGLDRLPETGRVFHSPYFPNGSLVVKAPLVDRVVSVTGTTENSGDFAAYIEVVDRSSRATAVNYQTYVPAPPDSMALLDRGRIALALTNGSISLAACTAALTPLPATDLKVGISVVPASPHVGESVTITLTVTNQGNLSSGIGLTCHLPPGLTNITSADRLPFDTGWLAPTTEINFDPPFLPLGGYLAPGQSITQQFTGQFAVAGPAVVRAGVTPSAGVDPQPWDNHQTLTVPVQYSLAPGDAVRYRFSAQATLFEPKRRAILSIAGFAEAYEGELVTIDQATGLVLNHTNIGPQVIALALTTDSTALYALSAGGRDLLKIDPQSFVVLRTNSVGPAQTAGWPPTASGIMIDPGNPEQLVLRRSDGFNELYVSGNRTSASVGKDQSGGFFASGRFASGSDVPNSLITYSVSPAGFQIENGGKPGNAEIASSFLTSRRAPWLLDTTGHFTYPEFRDQFNPLGLYGGLDAFPGIAIDWQNRLSYFTRGVPGIEVRDLDTQASIRDEYYPFQLDNLVAQAFLADQEFIIALEEGSPDPIYSRMLIVRSPSPISGSRAELSIGLAPLGPQVPGQFLRWMVSVTNAGPSTASNAWVNLHLPDFMSLAQPAADLQPTLVEEPYVSFNLGNLNPGQTFQFPFTAVRTADGANGSITASVHSDQPNPAIAGRVTTVNESLSLSNAENHIGQLPILAENAIYEAATQTLLLTTTAALTGTNAILEMDPTTGTILRQVLLPGVPGALALSPGDESLYVALDDAHRLARLTLPGLEPGDVITTPFQSAPAGSVLSIVPLPGPPARVVISGLRGGDQLPMGIWVYDGTVPRARSIPGGDKGIGYIQRGYDTNTLIGFSNLNGTAELITLDAGGLTQQAVNTSVTGYSSLEFYTRGNNLLTPRGLFDLKTLAYKSPAPVNQLLDALALSDDGITPLAAGFRTPAVVWISGHPRPSNPSPSALASEGFWGGVGPVKRLVHWGRDGFAAVLQDSILLGHLDFADTAIADSNTNGIPDIWETEHSFDLLAIGTAGLDTDGDGASNLEEYLFGTDPRDADSHPHLQMVIKPDGGVRLIFQCAAGTSYSIGSTYALDSTSAWTDGASGISSGGPQVEDLSWANLSQGNQTYFFRISVWR